MTTKAFAYLRTSSATNVGAEKDSDKRQRSAILAYAKAARIEIVGEYYDAAVAGADLVTARPAFTAMLQAIAGIPKDEFEELVGSDDDSANGAMQFFCDN